MIYKYPKPRIFFIFLLLSCWFNSNAQTAFTDKIPEWKKTFPKEEVVANLLKEVIDFTLNSSAGAGEAKVKAKVSSETVLVPVKDFLKYEDGLFYNDEMSVDNIKVLNPDKKEVNIQKLCGDYSSENIFHSDAKLCIVKFPLAEKGKPFNYTFQENYHDVKYLTSFYFLQRYPVIERIVQFNIPSWLDVDLREFNFEGYTIQKTTEKEGDITKIIFRMTNIQAYKRLPHSSLPHLLFLLFSLLSLRP
jgi:hypothetical protein